MFLHVFHVFIRSSPRRSFVVTRTPMVVLFACLAILPHANHMHADVSVNYERDLHWSLWVLVAGFALSYLQEKAARYHARVVGASAGASAGAGTGASAGIGIGASEEGEQDEAGLCIGDSLSATWPHLAPHLPMPMRRILQLITRRRTRLEQEQEGTLTHTPALALALALAASPLRGNGQRQRAACSDDDDDGDDDAITTHKQQQQHRQPQQQQSLLMLLPLVAMVATAVAALFLFFVWVGSGSDSRPTGGSSSLVGAAAAGLRMLVGLDVDGDSNSAAKVAASMAKIFFSSRGDFDGDNDGGGDPNRDNLVEMVNVVEMACWRFVLVTPLALAAIDTFVSAHVLANNAHAQAKPPQPRPLSCAPPPLPLPLAKLLPLASHALALALDDGTDARAAAQAEGPCPWWVVVSLTCVAMRYIGYACFALVRYVDACI
jgi:hypothetical protein